MRLIAGHFLRNRSIHVVLRVGEVRLEGDDRAQAVVYAGTAGSPVEGFEQLLALSTDLTRLELGFEVGGEVRLIAASWRRATPEEALAGR